MINDHWTLIIGHWSFGAALGRRAPFKYTAIARSISLPRLVPERAGLTRA